MMMNLRLVRTWIVIFTGIEALFTFILFAIGCGSLIGLLSWSQSNRQAEGALMAVGLTALLFVQALNILMVLSLYKRCKTVQKVWLAKGSLLLFIAVALMIFGLAQGVISAIIPSCIVLPEVVLVALFHQMGDRLLLQKQSSDDANSVSFERII